MSQDRPIAFADVPPWRKHWPVLLTGMGVTAAAVPLSFAPPWLRLLLVGSGLILAGQAIILRLRQAREEVEERVESAAVIGLAGVTAVIGQWGLDKAWDSATMVLWALTIAAAIGVALVLMNLQFRRIAISLLAVFHFGGVLTTVTMLPPPGPGSNSPPFLATQAWVYVYRHYLDFLFMKNAYHFYSPEPGPPTLFWFKLNYEVTDAEGNKKLKSDWYKMPNREDSPVNLHYQRLLSITESCNSVTVPAPQPLMDNAKQRRDKLGEIAPQFKIPYNPFQSMAMQYQPPTGWSEVMIAAVARRIGRQYAHLAGDPSAKLVSIKFYRVRHDIMTQASMADNFSPLDKSLYHPVFEGEFFPDGTLVNPQDPYLYWEIPIFYGADSKILDYLTDHADMDYNQADREKRAEDRP